MDKNVITLGNLTFDNFKGIRKLEIPFDPKETNIYGKNRAGKSSIVDGFYFLLYGKDAFDRKEFDVKNTKHPELNKLDHVVEGTLIHNGRKEVLKHVFKEKWEKKHGEAEKTFKGNINEYFWNGLSMTATEYASRVNDILPENVFKILTNPLYFNDDKKMPKTARRSVLEKLANVNGSDIEIAESIGGFENLIREITDMNLTDFKKKVRQDINALKKKIEEYKPKIDENLRNIPDYTSFLAVQNDTIREILADNSNHTIDVIFIEIQKQIDLHTQELAIIDDAIANRVKAHQTKLKGIQDIQNQVHQLQTSLSTLSFNIKQGIQNEQNAVSTKITAAKNSVEVLESDLKSKRTLLESKQTINTRIEKDLEELKQNWAKQKTREFVYDESKFSCPTCARDFETDDIEESKRVMRENFDAETKRILDETNTNGLKLKAEKESNDELIATISKAIETIEAQIVSAKAEYKKVNAPLESVDTLLQKELATNKDYLAIQKQIDDLQLQLKDMDAGEVDTDDLKAKKAPINQLLDDLKAKLLVKNSIADLNKRIAELEKEQAIQAQEQSRLEGLEYQADQLTKIKITEVEKKVNSMFKKVTFKMYSILNNGGEEEDCTAYFDGVPWPSLNSAGKIQAGMDIIETIGTFYGYVCPIFLDNRESTTEIPETSSQVINLFVSPEDTSLRIA